MFSCLLALGALFLSTSLLASARQIPVINGVVGDVPTEDNWSTAHSDFEVKPAVTPAATTPGKLRVVENSGICETTPGVYQASGYGDITSTESIWYAHRDLLLHRRHSYIVAFRFWFFAARQNSATAPLAIWLNGGVSCSVAELS